jgi:hypothetical protein
MIMRKAVIIVAYVVLWLLNFGVCLTLLNQAEGTALAWMWLLALVITAISARIGGKLMEAL